MAILRTLGQRRIVIHASDTARRRGVRVGMTAAEAKALDGMLFCFADDPPIDRRALEALGRWMTRFTPAVSCEWDDDENDDIEPPAALWLDLTGCERLFGGIGRIAEAIAIALKRFNIPATLAVAPTVGSAWAFACTTRQSPLLVDAAQLPRAICALPVTTLRLTDEVLRRLGDLGLVSVGDLLALPRALLPSRFGPLLLKRLDQLTGELPEPLVGLVYDPPVSTSHRFDAPIESPEQIGVVFLQLLDALLPELIRRGHGIRVMRLTLTPDRGWAKPIVCRDITLSRPHRHRKTLLELIGRQIEGIDCEHGFVLFRLDVPIHEPISDTQADFCDSQSHADAMEFDLLLQRLHARLGENAVIRPQPVESYLPERAWRQVCGDEPPALLRTDAPPRPLTCFPTPIEIAVLCEPSDERTGRPRQFTWRHHVHRLAHIIGPERIGGEWWRGHRHTRDYFEVEDDTGQRFWIFRVPHFRWPDRITMRWFLHGRFD